MNSIPTLLLSGANNHDWERTSPFLANFLGANGFSVTLTTEPETILEDAASLRNYHLIFTDYNGPSWSEKAKCNFAEAIEQGAGLVIFHAANNCFSGWREYEQMCALGFRESSGHGQFADCQVRISGEHPSTRGLETFTTTDEVYHGMERVGDAPFEVLATAFSDPAKGGTGRDEPVVLAVQWGQGRIFHLMLGHVWPGDPNGGYRGASLVAIENAGFQSLLLGGCQWAARESELEVIPSHEGTTARKGN